MTGKERISNILKHQAVDRIGLFEHFWNDTHAAYTKQGHIKENENFDDHFGFDMSIFWAFDLMLDLDFEPETIADDDTTRTIKDGNGAILRRHKLHDSTPEHIDYTIKERGDWENVKHLLFDNLEKRINFEGYREAKTSAEKAGRFFAWSGVNVFESIHPVCGHENMLINMALDPEWIEEMAQDYGRLLVELQEILFEREGYPDGVWFYEDMGFKNRPFMSPQMYMDLIFPVHKFTMDYAHSKNLPVIVHSCGFVEPLIPGLIEAGMDCLQTIEIKAGMDVLKLHRDFGDKIALMGGIDVRTLYTNDRKIIDAELERIIPVVKNGYGFVAHSDHSIPKTVEYDTLRYYIKRVLELGIY